MKNKKIPKTNTTKKAAFTEIMQTKYKTQTPKTNAPKKRCKYKNDMESQKWYAKSKTHTNPKTHTQKKHTESAPTMESQKCHNTRVYSCVYSRVFLRVFSRESTDLRENTGKYTRKNKREYTRTFSRSFLYDNEPFLLISKANKFKVLQPISEE